jgi:salicylate hydroxylase
LVDALAQRLALDAGQDLASQLRAYARMRYWHSRVFQAASAMFTPFYQSDCRSLPAIRDGFAAPLSRMPVGRQVLARLVSALTVPPIARTSFESFREPGAEILASRCALRD